MIRVYILLIFMAFSISNFPVFATKPSSHRETFVTRLKINDRKRSTLTPLFTLEETTDSALDAGRLFIEETVKMSVINHDDADTTILTLRRNTLTYKKSENGIFLLDKVSDMQDDLKYAVRLYRIYDLGGSDPDNPLDAEAFRILLLQIFPIKTQFIK